jgi:DNA modification methylase
MMMSIDALSKVTLTEGISGFFKDQAVKYLLVKGDAKEVLPRIPSNSISICITSPPYWQERKYEGECTIGLEETVQEYVQHLTEIFHELKNTMRDDGSFWLNIGDKYEGKNLQGVPWLVACSLQNDGWILRNAVIWDKVKGNPSNAKDKLRNIYEYVFHFVKSRKYYYDLDEIRDLPGKPYYKNGKIVTATGVSGVRYERQIRASNNLSKKEKEAALKVLKDTLQRVRNGEIPDFRMIIRGEQRTTHSDSVDFSGRARELLQYGFYILPYHKKGAAPSDIWRIIPEDRWRKDTHFAVFPEELCEIPIKTSCPHDGILIDPFVGTGTAVVTALKLGRRAIGIDVCEKYLSIAEQRITDSSLEPKKGNGTQVKL